MVLSDSYGFFFSSMPQNDSVNELFYYPHFIGLPKDTELGAATGGLTLCSKPVTPPYVTRRFLTPLYFILCLKVPFLSILMTVLPRFH